MAKAYSVRWIVTTKSLASVPLAKPSHSALNESPGEGSSTGSMSFAAYTPHHSTTKPRAPSAGFSAPKRPLSMRARIRTSSGSS